MKRLLEIKIAKINLDSDKVNAMIKEIGHQCQQFTNTKPHNGLFDII